MNRTNQFIKNRTAALHDSFWPQQKRSFRRLAAEQALRDMIIYERTCAKQNKKVCVALGGKGMDIKTYENFHLEEIINLYQSVGWTNYLERIGILEEAYANSLCVLGAYDSDRLVGIIRAVGDGQTIVFVQDIIVLPEYQRKGIGTKLLKTVVEKYKNVHQMELLTDNTEKTKAFYRSVGFTASDDVGCVAFIRM